MRWIMDVLQHARYKQPSCGVSLSGFLSEAGGPMKEKTQSSSSHLDYLPSPVPSPETSRKLNSGKDLAVPSSCLVGSGDAGAQWVSSGHTRGAGRAGAGSLAGQSVSAGAGPALLCHGEHSSGVPQEGKTSEPSLGSTSAGAVHAQAEPLSASPAPRRLARAVG